MISATYNEMQTPRDILPAFYQQYQLGDDGGQSSAWVRIEFVKKISLYIPNFDARRKAIFKHDVHHIATGYTSTLRGETEIGAWEIGSGCRHYWVAFVLDISAVMMGMLFNPIAVYRAFVKGRRTKNLYYDSFTDEQVMDMPVAEIRRRLLLTGYAERNNGNLYDIFLFIGMLIVGVVYSVMSLLLLPLVLIYSTYVALSSKKRK